MHEYAPIGDYPGDYILCKATTSPQRKSHRPPNLRAGSAA